MGDNNGTSNSEDAVKALRPGIWYEPKNIVATYKNDFGDTKIIHRPHGGRSKALREAKGCNTPALRMNRACAKLIGQKIKERRMAAGLTLEDLARLAGLASQTPKQYMFSIENAKRNEGVRIGTLFALAYALECEVADFFPTVAEVAAAADVQMRITTALA